ncbi:MAG: TRAP transporter large permease subunit [Dehalococcoidia bacterium]|nr:MAG: TRAP transporter large permease subunit [Dehalococcoidia bacterium]UCG83880.1 MAG: TRAP transporter large permease subunit [Dehalococcoidia bacterium]
MSDGVLTGLLFGSMLLVVFSGLPISFALGGLATVFILVLWGPDRLLLSVMNTYGAMTNYLLVAVPLFVFMSSILEKTGIAEDFFDAIQNWVGGLRGGLAIGTVLMSVVLAAMVGISAASTAILGLIALPAMLKRNYNKEIALGCIQAGGALGVLIPPSVLMIIIGLFGEISVGQLFIGGIFPGLVLGVLFVLYIATRCRLQPHLGPSVPPDERANWKQKFISLRVVMFPLILILIVMGTIFAGIATVTEAAGMGAMGSILIAILTRRLTWQNFKEACYGTLRISGMIMWIVFGAAVFTAIYHGIGTPAIIEDILTGVPGGNWVPIIVMVFILIILGCFLDPGAITMITIPIFIPIVVSLGFEPLWFGIVFVIIMEMGYLTPPFGMNLFVMKGVAPPGITMGDIYRSIIPFVLLQMAGLAVIMLFPQLALWLPGLMIK